MGYGDWVLRLRVYRKKIFMNIFGWSVGVNLRVVFFELGLGDLAKLSSIPLDGPREHQMVH
jgi:hypothetical protein